MQEKMKQLLGIIRRSAELIREHERSRPFRDRLIVIGAENIIALSEEGIKELGEDSEESPVNCQKTV
jgi:hypothetical protein